MIAVHGAGSPVLVVFNAEYSSVKNYDLEALRRAFAGLISDVEERTVNFNNEGDGRFIDLVNTIKNKLTNLKHVRQPVPKSWARVREELLYRKESFIEEEQFVGRDGICEENGVKNAKQGEDLAKLLHDSGIVFKYKSFGFGLTPLILKPKWITDALFRILGDRRIIQNNGRFTTGQAFDLWWEYAEHEKLILLNSLHKGYFEVAYKLEGEETYVVPMLLPAHAPEFAFDETSAMHVSFEYEFKPQGVLSHLIVRLSREIVVDERTGEQIVWRNGVLLRRDESTARVVEIDETRTIVITVASRHAAQGSEFLTSLRNEIKRIHRDFYESRLQFEESIEGVFLEEPSAVSDRMTIAEQYALVNEISPKMSGAQLETIEKLADQMLRRSLNAIELNKIEWHEFSQIRLRWESKVKFSLPFVDIEFSKDLAPEGFIAKIQERLDGADSNFSPDESPGNDFAE
jgi:hypothetical protein